MRMLRSLFCFCLFLSLGFAQTDDNSQSTAAQAASPTKGVLSGIVTDAATGQPLKKTTIVFRNSQAGGQRFQQPLATSTGIDGRFSMQLDPGEYRLIASRNGYVRQSYGSKDARRPGTIITLAANQTINDIKFQMVPGGVITGRVIDEDGEPMSGVTVQALRAVYADGERQLQPSGGMGRTDDRGEYRIFGLLPRRYYVSATRRGMMDFMTGPGEDGPGPPGMMPQAEGYAAMYYPGVADPSAASAVDVKAGDEQRVNFSLVPSRTYKVGGRVFDSSGQPLKQGFGVLMPRSGGGGRQMMSSNFAQIQNGKFEVHGVLPGSYSLMIGVRDEEAEGARRDVEVADQDVTGINLTLSPGTEIHGTVKFVDFTGKQPDLNIMLAPKRQGTFFGMTSGTVKPDGSFVLKGVFPEDYITSVNVPMNAYLKSVKVGGDETVTSGFNGAKATTMEIVISGKAATIEGTVTDADGKPYPGATVVLTSDKPLRSRRNSGPETTSTDQNGHFVFRGLRPANYSVSAWDDIDEEEYSDPDFSKRQEGRFTAVKVGEGESQTKDLKLVTSEQRLASKQ